MERFRKSNLSAYLNFLRTKYEAYSGAVRVESHPYYAMVDPCDLCQLRCPTCPTGIENAARGRSEAPDSTYRTDRGRMSKALFEALMAEVGEFLFLVDFHSWGEPLLNEDFPALIRSAKKHEISTHTHTNLAMKLTDQRIEELLSSGLDFLIASVDGFSQETYERFRVGGEFELAKENMWRVARARDRLGAPTQVIYKFLVFSWNEHEVERARTWASDAGLGFLAQDAIVPDESWLPSYRRGEKTFLTVADVDRLEQKWTATGDAAYWRRHERHDTWMPVSSDDKWIPSAEREAAPYCAWHYFGTVVQPAGHIAPCCITAKSEDRFGKLVVGETRLEDVCNGEPFQTARAAFAGLSVPGANADNICTRCYFPDAFKQVPSSNDTKIVDQYFTVFRGADPVLDEAFELLSNDGTTENRSRFVKYFDDFLPAYFDAAGSGPSS